MKNLRKGFSLVELIVVIAIMAVLMGVLAPTLLKNVEKSRLQTDKSAMGELVNTIKIAVADDKVNSEIIALDATTKKVSVSVDNAGVVTVDGKALNAADQTHKRLANELAAAGVGDLKFKSSTIKGTYSFTIEVTASTTGSSIQVKCGQSAPADVNTKDAIDDILASGTVAGAYAGA